MKVQLAADLQPDSIVDGDGIRTVIWFQGCPHKCPGCQNPETHNINEGITLDIEEVKEKINQLEYQNGITLSGGDPFMQPKSASEIAQYAHSLGYSVWCYTGYLYEVIIKDEKLMELLKNIDVLIDGPFLLKEKSLNCKFRGSKNQRIIDVQKSLEQKEVVLYYED
ncbi:MAG: anaerobic ribonucleoside-triphosphate reductase activating protein [Bacilli bacterium]|nr:anaerobic ribonucleoside-triphosphate reductase activating protein [Bacilli bacterium]